MFEAGPRGPDVNWVLVDDVASLEVYRETFKLGRLVPLTDKLVPFTEEELSTRGLLTLVGQRREEVNSLNREATEQTTYYTVLEPKKWAEMRHELTKPKKTPLMRRSSITALQERVEWFDGFLRDHQLPTSFTFVMTNTAIIGADLFWPLRCSHNGQWEQLIAENVPPSHQFKRRT